ncbi:MAG TPA: energy transducer TonB [Pyrinomonadaceae bacterium]|jgi:TonB family protein|nr:energy transducer TonB [Pyrinomonadaceae bacterium]
MKPLAGFRIAVCFLWATASPSAAQYANPEWIELSPPGESFQVLMPNQARAEIEKLGAVSGMQYTTTIGVADYTIWSLTNSNYRAGQDKDLYLDSCAELVWEGLLKPAREKLDDKARRRARMTYVRELPAQNSATPTATSNLPGREYTLTVGDVTGKTEFFVAQEHVYVMLAMGKPEGDWLMEKFFASFRGPASEQPELATKPLKSGGGGPGISEPTSSATDYNRIFSGREVTQKARVLSKPEPTYTEGARKFAVEGTVILRCVFSKNGEVTNLHVVQKLPHGLTEKAISAARGIRFTPAMKDGQPVSMWMELQYNFNLY